MSRLSKEQKTKATFVLLAKISAAYQNFQTNEYTVQVWLEGLRGLRYQDVYMALNEHIKQSPFPPTIADIRAIAEPETRDWFHSEVSKKLSEERKLLAEQGGQDETTQ